MYGIPKDVDLNDVLEFVYRDSMQHDVQRELEALLGDVDPSHPFEERVSADSSVSWKKITVGVTGRGQENTELN